LKLPTVHIKKLKSNVPGLKAASNTVPEWHGNWCNTVAVATSQTLIVPSLVPDASIVFAALRSIVFT